MTINEIYKAALRLMFANYEEDLDATGWNVDSCGNETYLAYLRNMREPLNRCLGIFERSGVLPPHRLVIKRYDGAGVVTSNLTDGVLTLGNGSKTDEETALASLGVELGTYRNKYVLGTLANGFIGIVDVRSETDSNYTVSVGYTMEGDTLVLGTPAKGERQIIMYKKRLTRVPATAAYTYNVDLPDELCELIPYFIKAELYEEDEPQLAVVARNYFEAALEDCRRVEGGQTGVIDVFGFRS